MKKKKTPAVTVGNYISVQSESMDPPVGLSVFRTNSSLTQGAPYRKRGLLDGLPTIERKAMFHSQRPDILPAILNQRTFFVPPEPIYGWRSSLSNFPDSYIPSCIFTQPWSLRIVWMYACQIFSTVSESMSSTPNGS